MSPKLDDSLVTFLGEMNSPAGSSSSAILPQAMNLREANPSGDSSMGRSPPKELLKEAVIYLEEKVDDVEQKAESYIEAKVKEVKKGHL